MRMRKKKNLAPRLEAVSHMFAAEPPALRERIGGRPVWVELGCGLGSFAAKTAEANPGIFYTAFERVSEAIVVAAERASKASIENIAFLRRDADELDIWFNGGELERLYIQFCDPWHKARHVKRRLTHRDFLSKYAKLLSANGELIFKTDNMPLFEFTLDELTHMNWDIIVLSGDWHTDSRRAENEPVTEYESKFLAKGQQIGMIRARPCDKKS